MGIELNEKPGFNSELIKLTWEQVVPIAEVASELFYENLFKQNPTLKSMFHDTDMESQRSKLVHALSVVVASADNLAAMTPLLEQLGQKHRGYGVSDSHYDDVGVALLQTLETGLGAAWNTEVKDAWAGLYTVVADTMCGRGVRRHRIQSELAA